MTPFRVERLGNGVTVEFVDCSNRYFGDYHRVCVEVRITAGHSKAGADRPQQVRQLERMGVAGAEVAAVRNRLADDYWCHAGRYLAHPEFPARLLASPAAQAGGLYRGRR